MSITPEQRTNLQHNINLILETLGCSPDNINNSYSDFPITRSTLRRWREQVPDNPSQISIQKLGTSFYNHYFIPPLPIWHDLLNKKIINIQLKPKEEYQPLRAKRYEGSYYIYYYSNHYADIIHGGRLLVYSDGDSHLRARFVLGIHDMRCFNDSQFKSIFSPKITSEQARHEFELFRKSRKTPLQKRCYFYEGLVTEEKYMVRFEFKGVDYRSEHKQTLLLNVKREKMSKKTFAPGSYKGGLGLILAPPNEEHPEIRSFRVGISDFMLSFDDEQLKKILTLQPDKFNRSKITENDDKEWYDLILLREQEAHVM